MVTFHLDDAFLENGIKTGIAGRFSFSAQLDLSQVKDPSSVTFNFPGTADPIVLGPYHFVIPSTIESMEKKITTEGGGLREVVEDGKSVYYADFSVDVKVAGTTSVKDVVLEDTLGANFDFKDAVFTLKKPDGSTAVITPTSNDKNVATFNLGELAGPGTYSVLYSAKMIKPYGDAENNGNTAKLTWDGEKTGKTSSVNVDYQSTLLTKSGVATEEEETKKGNAKWTIMVNDPNGVKADVSNLQVHDNLSQSAPGQGRIEHIFSGTITVRRVGKSGESYILRDKDITAALNGEETILNLTFNSAKTNFTYTLPADAGTDTFYIECYSKAADQSKIHEDGTKLENMAIADGKRVSAPVDVKPVPIDGDVQIEKSFVSREGDVANWKVVIKTADLKDTVADDLVYSDTLSEDAQLDENSIVVMNGTTQLDEMKDEYEYEAPGEDGSSFQLYFMTDITSANDITITYQTNLKDADYVGNITNTGTVTSKKITKINHSDTDEYEIVKNAVQKTCAEDVTYDAEKKAYVATWTMKVGPDALETTEPYNFGNISLVLNDTWKNTHMKYGEIVSVIPYVWEEDAVKAGEALTDSDYSIEQKEVVTKDEDGKDIPKEKQESGFTLTIPKPGKRSFVITYTTEIPDSEVLHIGAASETFNNTVKGTQDKENIGDTSVDKTVDYTEKVLSKEGIGQTMGNGKDDIYVYYTIKVNTNAKDLVENKDRLTLTDKLTSANGKLIPSTVVIKDGNNTDSTLVQGTDYEQYYDAVTKLLTLEIPDSRSLVITYQVEPLGTEHSMVWVDNQVSLEGKAEWTENTSTETEVKKAAATVTGEHNTLSIHKMNEHGGDLEGAIFSLTPVVTVDGNDVVVKEGTPIVGTEETNSFGMYKFKNVYANTAYIVKETKTPTGYKSQQKEYLVVLKDTNEPEMFEKVLAAAKDAYKTLAQIDPDGISVDDGGVYEVTNIPATADFKFNKVVTYLENCYKPQESTALEDVTFSLYKTEDCSDKAAAAATSDKDGVVSFTGIGVGTWYMKETAVPTNVEESQTITPVVVKDDGTVTIDGKVADTTVITNEVKKVDIRIVKVDKDNEDKKLPGALYGLYRSVDDSNMKNPMASESTALKAAKEGEDSSLIKIAEATTDEDGILKFDGVVAGVTYTIKELTAPDGSQVSKNPIELTYKIGDDKPTIVNNGEGTVKDENGNITWLEPSVKVSFAKVDENNQPLEGASLQIEDEDGKVVEGASWVSTKEPHVLEGVLVTGKTYYLVETKAPAGYEIAEKVEVKVEAKEVGPDEDYVQTIKMVDKKTATATPTPTPTPGTKITTRVGFSKVDEKNNMLAGASLQVEDEDGNVIEKWTSAKEAHILENILTVGKTYYLVETKAPTGYAIAAKVKVSVKAVTGDEIQSITMVDKKSVTPTPTKKGTTTTTTKKSNPTTTSKAAAAKTADESNIGIWLLLMAVAGCGITVTFRRKKVLKNR